MKTISLRNLIVSGLVLVVMAGALASLGGCIKDEKKGWAKDFDLSEPKEYWEGTIDEDFSDHEVMICFRKTTTYPELKVSDLNLKNAESLRYIMLRPNRGEDPNNFTQIAVVTLKEPSKENVIKAIKVLEKRQFIRYVGPNPVFDTGI